MKPFWILLLMALPVLGQNPAGLTYVRTYDTLTNLLRATPGNSEAGAMIKGLTSVAAADGFFLFYDRSSTATPNGSTIFQPVTAPGRWFRLLGIGTAGPAYLSTSSDIRIILSSTLLSTVDSATITNVLTLGRAVSGDMGGGRYVFVTNAPAGHVNNGTVWRDGANTGNWYYDLVQAKHGLNVLLWEGVRNNGGSLCDAGIASAISFCLNPSYGSLAFQTNAFTGPYSTNQFAKLALHFPPGVYNIATVTNPGISMFGAQGSGYGAEYTTNAIVKLQHDATARAPMIVANQSGFTIAGITFAGLRELTITNHQGVTGWTARTNFTFAGSDPDPIAVYDRAAFFFAAANSNYLGCGLLNSVGTNVATLALNEDLYSSDITLPSNDSMKVVFAPIMDINGTQAVSSALSGPPAILIYGTAAAGYNDMVVKDCFIDNFHSGIVIDSSESTPSHSYRILNTTITRYNWAAVSSAFAFQGVADCQIDNCLFDGAYAKNSNGTDPNSAYTNKFLRNGRWGVYGASGNVQVGSLAVKGSHTAVKVGRGSFSAHSIIASDCSREAVLFRKWLSNDAWVTNSQPSSIESLSIGVPFTGSESYNTWTLNTNATGIRLDSTYRVHVGAVHVPILDANNQALPTVYRMIAGRMHLDSTISADNVTGIRLNNEAYIATTGDFPQSMTKAQRNIITSLYNGLTIYQLDATPGIRMYSNSAWVRFTETADP